MIIGINASYLTVKQKTGVENYASQLILALLEYDSENTYYLFSPRHIDKSKLPRVVNYKLFTSPFPRGWHRFRLPLSLLRHKVDIFFDPGYTVPPFVSIPSIVTIHDLAAKYYPEAYSSRQAASNERSYILARDKAKGLIFTSQNTQRDFEKFYPNSKALKTVIYQGFPEKTFDILSRKQRDILKLDEKYILFVGRLEHRKNILGLIRAYIRLRHLHPEIKHKLVLAGKEGTGYDEIRLEIEKNQKFRNDIIEIGYVKENDLPFLYNQADLFAFPSLYEGYGIPILEAFSAGVPVLTSDTSSLPEVAGEAAFYCDPNDLDDITTGLFHALTDHAVRDQHVSLGRKISKEITWQKYCESFLKFAHEVADENSHRS